MTAKKKRLLYEKKGKVGNKRKVGIGEQRMQWGILKAIGRHFEFS